MSYQNFKPTFWSKHIQTELERLCTLADWCNTQFEGEAKKGEKVKIKAEDLLAVVFSHEIDHLDGVLFIDKADEIYDAEEED